MQNGLDPYTPGEPVYECLECGSRSDGGTGGACGDCGGTVRNIAVPREQSVTIAHTGPWSTFARRSAGR